MYNSKTKDYLLITLGTTLMTIGIYFFKFPNNFSTGGVSGISLILGNLISTITPGALVFIINMILLVVGFLVFGKKFGIKTAYSSILFSMQIWLLEYFIPLSKPFTDEPLLELVFAIMLPAIGSAILFNIEASSGGTDIVAMILKKYTNIDIGKALLASDCLIVFSAFFVFGMKTGLFSLLGLAAKAFVVDTVIESINLCKYFTIITTKPSEINSFITSELKRGTTNVKAEGGYTYEEKTIIITVVKRSQAVKLQREIKKIDADAFILITDTSHIIGKGFRGI